MNKFNWCGSMLLAALVFIAGGCSFLRAPAKQTQSLMRSFEGTLRVKPATNGIALMQGEVMREADAYATIIAQATDDFATKVGTADAHIEALKWKLQQATAAFVNATDENPNVGAVDMVVLACISRRVVEKYWVGEKFGPAAQPLLEAHTKLEQGAWSVVAPILTRGQEEELRQLLSDWWQRYPDQRYVGAIRLREFSALREKSAGGNQLAALSSVLNLLKIDPLGDLDPAVRAVEQTRYSVERMMFYVERAPMLVSWQAQLLSFQIAEQPSSQQVLSNLNSLSRSAEAFAATAQQLPKLVDTQREAAINQVFAGVAIERSNILASLNAQEAQLRELLPEVRQTFAAGGNMANSLNGAIKSLDAFVRYVSPPETNPASAGTNSQPFNVLDYGTAATQIATMSKDLNLLIASANQSATQLVALSEQATAKANQVVSHAFWLALLLVIVLLAGSVLAALAYRSLARRLSGNTRDPAA